MNEEIDNLLALKNKWRKKAQEAEGELAIIKGIGNKSPEMEALKKELTNINKKYVNSLKELADLKVINQAHQELNGQLRIEITRLKGGM